MTAAQTAITPGPPILLSRDIRQLPAGELGGGEASRSARDLGLTRYRLLAAHVRALPYGRNSARDDRLVLAEGRGTCSTKHALLARVAAENALPVKLVLGIYWMTAASNPPVRSVLEDAGLAGIPEAHCYLSVANKRIDLTAEGEPRPLRLFCEEFINPKGIHSYKAERHQAFIREWMGDDGSFEAIWTAREACIAAL